MFLLLHLTGKGQRDDMATVTNKRKVLSVEGKVKVTGKTENGKKKVSVGRNFVL